MFELLAILGSIITGIIWWKNRVFYDLYGIYFCKEGSDILFVEKKYINKDQREYDCEQIVSIALDPVKNKHFRLVGITDIIIKNIDCNYEFLKVKLAT